MKIYKSDYIKYSRFIVKKLHKTCCYGFGSMYENNALKGLASKSIAKNILDALIKQRIVLKKRKKYGWKYFLNRERYDKIKEIIKEKGRNSIIPILLML